MIRDDEIADQIAAAERESRHAAPEQDDRPSPSDLAAEDRDDDDW